MRDRMAAVRGELVIISSPGHGTRIMATIPVDDPQS
jgi:signal transduction histidine kinase